MREPRNPYDHDTPPKEWLSLLLENDEHLAGLRMLWRRGGGSYQPLTPVELCPDDRRQDRHFWEKNERAETHLEWKFDKRASPEKRYQVIVQTARKLWKIAAEWTHIIGPFCDFSLVGYGPDDEVFFESGKRCKVGEKAEITMPVAPSTGERGRQAGAIEVQKGDLVFRVWDRRALQIVIDALR